MIANRETIKTNLITWSKYQASQYNGFCWLFDHGHNKYYLGVHDINVILHRVKIFI